MSEPQSPPSAASVPPVEEERAVTLIDLLEVIVRRRWLIFWVTVITAVVVVGANIVAMSINPESSWNLFPNRYRATVKVLVSNQNDARGSAAATSLFNAIESSGSLSVLAGALGGQASSNAALAQVLLHSRAVLDELAVQQGFTTRGVSDPGEVLDARSRLHGNLTTEFSIASNVLSISYQHFFPEDAATGVAFVVELLRKKVHALQMEKVLRKKAFLEERLSAVGLDRSHAQETLISFQRQHGVFNLEVQSEQTLRELAALKTDLYQKEIQLLSEIDYTGENHPRVVRLRNEIEKLRMLIWEFKTGFVEFSESAIPLYELPELLVRHLDLHTELTVHDRIYALLRSEYESTRIEESSQAASFQVVDPAEVPYMKTAPSRFRICITATLVAFIAAMLMAFILEYLKRAGSDPVKRKQFEAIFSVIGRRK